MVRINLEGKSVVDVCLDILDGKYFSMMDDDRELQMSTCFFLGKNSSMGNQKVINGLLKKLNDTRPVHEYYDDFERGTSGSDYYVSACAAEVLVKLGYGDNLKQVYQKAKREGCIPQNTNELDNNRDRWSPRILEVVEDHLAF